MLGKLCDWLDDRIAFRKLRDAMLLEHVPGGARWRYVWGSTLAFVFLIQVVTGVLLMTAYSASDTDAWSSVHYIQYRMDFGWLIRGLHHFGSQTMVVLMAVHMFQVVVAGAQLAPREFNWWSGLILLNIVLGLSLTGYLLPWDQKGYYATQVATNILGGIPLIGPFSQKVLVGGTEYGNHTLTHFYALHVGILPPLLILVLVAHIALFRKHGVTAPAYDPSRAQGSPVLPILRDVLLGGFLFAACLFFHVPLITGLLIGGLFWYMALSRFVVRVREMDYFWPRQVFRDLVACLFVFGIMLSLVLDGGHGLGIPEAEEQLAQQGLYERWAHAGVSGLGVNLDAPADPQTQGYEARPEWYFLFLFQFLKYFTGDQELIGTVVVPGAVMLLLFLLPVLGYGKMRGFGQAAGVAIVTAVILGAGYLTLLAVADDAVEPLPLGLGGGTEKAKETHKRMQAQRREAARAVAAAYIGVPEEGARTVVRNDPVLQGPRLFERNCAVCHRYTMEPQPEEYKGLYEGNFTAPDLGGWGSKEWIKGLLDTPASPKYFGSEKKKGYPRSRDLAGMIEWREGVDELRSAMTKEQIAAEDEKFGAIAAFLADQKHPREKRDRALEQKALPYFREYCKECHAMQGLVEGGGRGPDLAGYGSAEWLRLMILNPYHDKRYGKRSVMPAFRPLEGPGTEVGLLEFFGGFPSTLKEKSEIKTPEELTAKGHVLPLSDIDREIIIRWMTGDDRIVFGGRIISAVPRPR